MSNSIKTFIIVAGTTLFIALFASLPSETKVSQGLATLTFIAVLWLSEALYVTITAISIPILTVIMSLMPTKSALHDFAGPNILLFFGGFALATTIHFQELDKIIAQRILILARGNFVLAVLYISFTTASLSMWMSNTAAAIMMLPLAIGMLSQLDYEEDKNIYVFVLLGIAFSANIGGIGTLVGTPPNAIVAANLNITFTRWLQYGIPIVIIFISSMILVLYVTFKPNLKFRINTDLRQKVPMDTQKCITLIIFAVVAMCWIFGSYINPFVSNLLGFEKKIVDFDSVIAILATVLVCAFRIVSWRKVQENTDWGVLMLFSGGITLSLVLKDSGADKIMANGIINLVAEGHLFLIGLLISLFIVFLTEFASNTTSAALLVPLFISMAESLGAPPPGLALIIDIGANCAFMLPVTTPPNAIVFGMGYIKQSRMVHVGIYLNVLCSIIIALMAYFFRL